MTPMTTLLSAALLVAIATPALAQIADRAALDRARDGGALTPAEKARLNTRENKASAAIDNDKHNDRIR